MLLEGLVIVSACTRSSATARGRLSHDGRGNGGGEESATKQ